MKKLFLLLAMMLLILASCSKDVVNNLEEENEMYTVQIGWGGELGITYEPLTKASTNDLYGVQVYSTPDIQLAEGQKATWSPYAYGLFNDPTNISINLLKGYKYKFVSTMVRDAKKKLSPDGGRWGDPFYRSGSKTADENKFMYDGSSKFTGLDDGRVYIYSHPNIDRYYGELHDYIPGSNNDKAKIKMLRVSFGAKFQVEGKLANSGKLEVLMEGAPKMIFALTDGDNQSSDIFSFSNVYSAWLNADNQYSEKILTTINWHRDDGTILPLGQHEITFKRNTTTVVKVEIDNDGESDDFGFEIDEIGDMPDGDQITIKDGEIVKTEVDPQ